MAEQPQPPLKLAGVMGYPITHSRSPRLHGHWLKRHGIAGAYLPLMVPPGELARALGGLRGLGFSGCNLTLPLKEKALALVDRADPLARRIGAVNTVVVSAQGELVGSNTDAFGFIENLKAGAPHWRADAGPAVVLGAGGAARAVLAALVDAGAREIRLVNRNRERAQTLKEALGGPIIVGDWRERSDALANAALLVNTTSLGMAGHEALEIKLDALPRTAIVSDLVYVPLMTSLLKAASARGNAVVDGLGMLLHQARPGFEAWFGVAPTVDDDLRRHVAADLIGA
ncbi:MAG: Shikimate 5-dehydrogenase [Alphaproteobacteria bacterium]|jgi:shikimate dehydrogenase|nr:Shikimate 5-dehydrogenase [Alphaproteobacteria bacterium]